MNNSTNLPIEVPSDALENLDLPFAGLDALEYVQVAPGPRVSSCHSNPKGYYGPVTIRNYLAGSVKKALRTKPGKVTQSNDIFVQLPIELQLMVLEHLHPIDLYHLSQTCKSLRRIIMNPPAIGVWKMAYARHPDLPKCPPAIREAKWTFLLFGPGICVECGKYGALTDFSLRKQYCEPCMKENYTTIQHLRDSANRVVSADHLVTSMVPRSFRYHGLRYTTSYVTPANAKYLRKDFNVMMKKVTIMQLLIDHGVPMLGSLFEEYKNRLISHNQNMEWFTDKANDWANRVFTQCSTEMDVALVTVTAKCKKRLKALGHNVVDINYVQYAISQSLRGAQIYKLTCRSFRNIRPKLEALITSQKTIRIKNERRQLLETRYREYQQALVPDAWQYQPPANFFHGAGGFSNFLNAEYVTRGDISRELTDSLFPGLVEEWTKRRQREVLTLLPEVDAEQPFEEQVKKFDLATSVVTCNDCKYMNQEGRALLGWKNICRHARRTVGGNLNACSGSEVVEPVAVVAAASLVRCVGLDPRTTTIQDMDSRDDRFFCGNCIPDTSNGVRGLKAYKWTECITHTMDMHTANIPTHKPPLWFLLTETAARFVREHEYAYPRATLPIWRCNICPAHYGGAVTQERAIDHVNKEHIINHPRIDVDFKLDKRALLKRRKQFRLGMEPAYEFQCKRCPDIPICKLWTMSNLFNHLREKHNIESPIQDDDWIQVQIIELQSTQT